MTKETLQAIKGDITTLNVDAIVNAANTSLLGGGGVDGAIHRAAGPALLQACKKLEGCATGQAKLTKGFNLPAKYIIHAVGPVWRGGQHGEATLLAACYVSSLQLALDYKISTIAFPAISCGIYHYPLVEATTIAAQETVHFLNKNATINTIKQVIFVCYNDSVYEAYMDALNSLP